MIAKNPENASQLLANEVLAELIALGVRDIVVCPGSRSQALALAAAAHEAEGTVRLHVRVDERSAAFFALGIGRESGKPAAVIVTSGTAVANLLPATLEAHYGRVAMVLLTADRPAHMRGTRSNQTVHDTSFTQEFVRYRAEIDSVTCDADEGATHARRAFEAATAAVPGTAPGPAHLNLAFTEPLSAALPLTAPSQHVRIENTPAEPGSWPEHQAATTYELDGDGFGTVVIAGDRAGEEAERFAMSAGLPLFAEPSSAARFGREAIAHYEEILIGDEALAAEIKRAIVFGHPTLTRVVPELLRRVETIVIDPAYPGAETYNPGKSVSGFANSAAVSEDFVASRPWLGAWVKRDRALREERTTVHAPDLKKATATGYKERSEYAREEVARMRQAVTREHLTEMVWQATWPHDRLVVASSRLIRVLNRQVPPRNIRVHANRGLAGIDGTVATALGVAVSSQTNENPRLAAGATRLLIGDLAFLHDVGSLALQPGEMRPRLQVIVGNDGGGTIFAGLEVAASSSPEAFKRVMLTPQNVNIEALAAAYGWGYRLVTNQGELESALTVPITGPEILEVQLP